MDKNQVVGFSAAAMMDWMESQSISIRYRISRASSVRTRFSLRWSSTANVEISTNTVSYKVFILLGCDLIAEFAGACDFEALGG